MVSDGICLLPALHIPTGDRVVAVGDKTTALKVLENGWDENLLDFGKKYLSKISNEEYFLVKC